MATSTFFLVMHVFYEVLNFLLTCSVLFASINVLHMILIFVCFLFSQYYSDANEVESWIKEMMPLVCSNDYGKDEASAQVSDWLLELACHH